jgi:glycosyltransferase involved in cell wall biosynthesis
VNPRHITRKARKVVAVSHSTKHDLLTLYKTPAEKIETVWSGVSDEFREMDKENLALRIVHPHTKITEDKANNEKITPNQKNKSFGVGVKEKYKLPEKFIFYFGTIEPRKNIQGLVRAYNEFRIRAEKNGNADLLEYDLVIAGYPGWSSDDIYTEIENSRYQYHIYTIEAVDSEDKVALYNCASIFVYPSFYEGFGFPALEAMKCGIPSIVSNNSSLPEIVNSGALLIDPDKPNEICDVMIELLSSPELHAKLKKAGLERSQEFRWEKTAEKMLAMFNKIK